MRALARAIRPIKRSIIARTHPPYYLIHKYWARKPHNVVRAYIEHFSQPNQVVLDPFVGSGVSVIEAVKAGRKSIGIDVNPIATMITYATAVPISKGKFEEATSRIRNEVQPLSESLFRTTCTSCGDPKSTVTHVVWANRYKCPNPSCGSIVRLDDTNRAGHLYRCPSCRGAIGVTRDVNDEVPTEIWSKCSKCGHKEKRPPSPKDTSLIQQAESEEVDSPVNSYTMLQNWRLLIFGTTTVSRFFTKRNLRILSQLVRAISEVRDDDVRQVLQVAFTGSVAQASRLVPYRGGLTSGGPAWTVSGFWVPNIHFEINAWICFENRLKRVLAGKTSLAGLAHETIGLETFRPGLQFRDLTKGRNVLLLNKSVTNLTENEIPDESVHYIFADPPYGDSVPYLEYGQLWYSWFGIKPDFEDEIVISNSGERTKDASDYRTLLKSAFSQCFRVLKKGHWMTITFNNKDTQTWESLLTAVTSAGFTFVNCTYQIPAVIPAKSQLVKDSSTKGDVILNFVKSPRKGNTTSVNSARTRNRIQETGKRVVAFHGGAASEDQVWRAVIMELLQNGGSFPSDRQISSSLQEVLIKEGSKYRLLPSDYGMLSKIKPLTTVVTEFVEKELSNGNTSELGLLSMVYDQLTNSLTPDMEEVVPIIRQLMSKAKATRQIKLPVELK
jgi:DNA modification methylase/predicted RNA-binding Zn-ribbon protein involved in translation (DUF1610 family)